MDYLLFALTFIPISLTPGFNMLLAFSLGLNLGYKKTLWAIVGQLIGLVLVLICCSLALSFILRYELAFFIFKILSALFLLYTAFCFWRAKGIVKKIEFSFNTRVLLFTQGFLGSVSNPKAWIFFLSLLPTFTNTKLSILMVLIVAIEFSSLSLYALGGSVFKNFMNTHLNKINKFSALCLAFLALSLFIEF